MTRRACILCAAIGLLIVVEYFAAASSSVVINARVIQVSRWGRDSKAIQSAIDSALRLGGAEIMLPSGVVDMDTSVLLSPGVHSEITIRGQAGTTLKMKGQGFGCFAFKDVPGPKLYDNFTFEDFEVDANHYSSLHKTGVLGFTKLGGVNNGSIENLSLRRITIMNLPTDTTGQRATFGVLIIVHKDSLESETYTRRITIEKVKILGGNVGITIGANNNARVRHAYDTIILKNCFHDTQVNNRVVKNWPAANFQVGSYSYGGSVLVENCRGVNSADVAVEINNPVDALVRKCKMINSLTTSYSVVNYSQVWRDSARQKIVFENSKSVYDSSVSFPSTAWMMWNPPGTTSIGKLLLRNCSLFADGIQNRVGVPFLAARYGARFESVIVTGCKSEACNLHLGPGTLCIFDFNCGQSSRGESVFKLADLKVKVQGSIAERDMNMCRPMWFRLAFKSARIDVHNVIFDCNVGSLGNPTSTCFVLGQPSKELVSPLRMHGSLGKITVNDSTWNVVFARFDAGLEIPSRIEMTDFNYPLRTPVANKTKWIRRFEENQNNNKVYADFMEGSIVPSRPVLLIPNAHKVFVEGSSTIDSIPPFWNGYRLDLRFVSGSVLLNNHNIRIPARIDAKADAVVRLVCDGMYWNLENSNENLRNRAR